MHFMHNLHKTGTLEGCDRSRPHRMQTMQSRQFGIPGGRSFEQQKS
jgi:hypothetical protein